MYHRIPWLEIHVFIFSNHILSFKILSIFDDKSREKLLKIQVQGPVYQKSVGSIPHQAAILGCGSTSG